MVVGRLSWGSFVLLLIGLVFGFDVVGSALNFLDSVSSGKFWNFDCWMIGSFVCGIVDFGPVVNGFVVVSVLLKFLDFVSFVKS